MFGLIKEYFEDYVAFWVRMGAVLRTPIDEVSYRARKDRGMRDSCLFLGFALLSNAVLMSLMTGTGLSDVSRIVVLAISAAVLTLLGCASFAAAWALCRVKGDYGRLLRIGFYFNGVYVTLSTVSFVLFYGAFKAIDPDGQRLYHQTSQTCDGGILAKMGRLTDILDASPMVATINGWLGTVLFCLLVAYWIASIRVYVRVFAMSRLQHWGTLILANIFTWMTWPIWFLIFLAISGVINGC